MLFSKAKLFINYSAYLVSEKTQAYQPTSFWLLVSFPLFHSLFHLFFSFFSVYSFDGVLVLALLIICTCAYITRVPRLKSFFLSEKKGFFGVFYKGKP